MGSGGLANGPLIHGNRFQVCCQRSSTLSVGFSAGTAENQVELAWQAATDLKLFRPLIKK